MNHNLRETRFSVAILETLKNESVAAENNKNSDLLQETLPKAIAIAQTHGKHIAFSHFTVGVILRLLGRPIEAESWFRRANKLQPDVLNTLQELVRCLGEQKRDTEALAFAKEAVSVAPNDAGAWSNLAVALAHCDKFEEARSAMNKAVSLAPNESSIREISENFDEYFAERNESPQTGN